jgi:thiamine monophosphate synthase
VAEVLDAGAFGVAVLPAVVAERDPAAAAARFRDTLDRALEARNDEPHLARAR